MRNSIIIQELLKTVEYYDNKGDEGRSHAYKRAINSIKRYDGIITSGEQAEKLKWIGKGIAAKIDNIIKEQGEIPNNNRTPDNIKTTVTLVHSKPRARTHERKSQTHMSRSKEKNTRNKKYAKNDKNIKTRSPSHQLKRTNEQPTQAPRTQNYRILRTKQDQPLPVKVSRNTINRNIMYIKKIWNALIRKKTKDRKYSSNIVCCGAYRRGAAQCPECIILIKTDIDQQTQQNIFRKLINIMYKINLIENTNTHLNTFKGMLNINKNNKNRPNIKIPLTIKLSDRNSWGCELLYWTGPSSFWENLKNTAHQQGMILHNHGLYHKTRGDTLKQLIHRDEYDILRDLGLRYIDPKSR